MPSSKSKTGGVRRVVMENQNAELISCCGREQTGAGQMLGLKLIHNEAVTEKVYNVHINSNNPIMAYIVDVVEVFFCLGGGRDR